MLLLLLLWIETGVIAGLMHLLWILSWRRVPVPLHLHLSMVLGSRRPRRGSRQADVRARIRRLLGRRGRRNIEGGHGGVLHVAVLSLDGVGVCHRVRAASRAGRAGSTPRRQQRVLRVGAAQRREQRMRRRGEGAEVAAVRRQRRRRSAAIGAIRRVGET
jgi:hypothetical protein